MKTRTLLLTMCVLVTMFSVSCSKDEDEGSTKISAAQKLAGIYNVVETEPTTSHNKSYIAVVTVVNDTMIKITDSAYANPPVFHWSGSIAVRYDEKKLKNGSTTVKGTITDDSNWEITYLFGTQTKTYSVKQVFKRQ